MRQKGNRKNEEVDRKGKSSQFIHKKPTLLVASIQPSLKTLKNG
jgi:hypothetical protein